VTENFGKSKATRKTKNRFEAKVNLKAIALLSPEKIDKISVYDLADRIIRGEANYRLLDLRGMDAYKKYNIPTSGPVSPVDILNGNFLRNEKVILYADDNLTEAKTWFVLKAEKYQSVYILDGGLSAWRDKILFPSLPVRASAEQKKQFAKMGEVSKFFGGRPQIADESKKVKKVLPKLSAPKIVVLKRSSKKKKREGC